MGDPPRSEQDFVAVHFDGRAPPTVAELEARMAILTGFAGGMLFDLDAAGRYLGLFTADPALLALPLESFHAGLTIADALGQELAGHFLAIIARVIASGTPETLEYSLDVQAGRRHFRSEIRRGPPSLRDPAVGTVTTLVRDVTSETELKAKLLEAERLGAMGLVAASIAHEIRQPLAFATTSLEVLARELGVHAVDGRAREALEHVRDALRRIGGIAASVGVVAAPDRHASTLQDVAFPARRSPRLTTTDVRRPVEAAVDLCASELQGRARVAMRIPDLPPVKMIEGELCQVIANLLLNAAHAVEARGDHAGTTPGPASSPRIDVSAAALETTGEVRIAITDDGCGIDPAYVARVFDPFFTTKEPGRGTGLGLFVSRRIVEEAGGTIAITSTLGRGTTVEVTLPAATDRRPCPFPLGASGRRLSILIIDDEPAFLRSLDLVLQDLHEVVVCGRSPDALALVRAEPQRFDAILCDLSMPEIDGVAFHRHMESLGVADRFILMTAGAFTPAGEEFLRQARCRRIIKPFAFEKLIGILGAVTRS